MITGTLSEINRVLTAAFGSMWHSYYPLRREFAAGSLCNVEGCDAAVTSRILVNVWGSVIEHDVCDEHKERWHGKNVDDFPVRKNAMVAV